MTGVLAPIDVMGGSVGSKGFAATLTTAELVERVEVLRRELDARRQRPPDQQRLQLRSVWLGRTP